MMEGIKQTPGIIESADLTPKRVIEVELEGIEYTNEGKHIVIEPTMVEAVIIDRKFEDQFNKWEQIMKDGEATN